MYPALAETASLFNPLAGKRVLIADRNQVTRAVMRDTCYTLGADAVHYATSGQEVLRAVTQREVEIILCEYLLDENRDGQQVLEELRTQKLIPLSVIFMMITAERSYKQVVAVAEFIPDDYLIKPFTTEKFRLRLVRANEKKQVFDRAYAFLEKNAYEHAIKECLNIAREHKRFIADAYRQVIDIYITTGRDQDAEELLLQVLAVKPVPWAQMELAVIRQRQGRVEEAEKILTPLVEAKQDFLSAYDRLASVKEQLGKDTEALVILEKAGARSSFNVNRLRRTADLAQRSGNIERAESLFRQVVERVRDSSMLEGSDLVNLSNVLVAQGKFEQAEKVAIEQRRLMKSHPEQEFISKIIEYQQAMKTGQAAKADSAVERLLQILDQSERTISPRLQLQVLEASLSHRRADTAIAVALRLAKTPGLDTRTVERVQKLLDEYRRKRSESRQLLAVEQITSAIAHIRKTGLNDDLIKRIRFSIDFWQKSGQLAADDAESLRFSLDAITVKFGASLGD
jgi:DNA-binding response OmpR family regulator